MLTAGAAAEVLPRHQHRRPLRLRPVQGEGRVGLAVPLAQVLEQQLAEADALDLLEEPRRNDGVRIDIGAVERDEPAVMDGEWLHGSAP